MPSGSGVCVCVMSFFSTDCQLSLENSSEKFIGMRKIQIKYKLVIIDPKMMMGKGKTLSSFMEK